jgi:hypothetical protein
MSPPFNPADGDVFSIVLIIADTAVFADILERRFEETRTVSTVV